MYKQLVAGSKFHPNTAESIGIELTHIQGDLYKIPFYDETY